MKMIIKFSLLFLISGFILSSCGQTAKKSATDTQTGLKDRILKKNFEKVIDGKQVSLYYLNNNNGAEAAITNYGGRLVALEVPNDSLKPVDVVLGYNSIDDYLNYPENFFGALIGRYGNRIANGKFKLDGKEYQLATNDGKNSLHGGIKGFNKRVWNAVQPNDSTLQLSYTSEDMEEGYPGQLKVEVTYTLTHDNALKIDYNAVTDKKTIINLTNHSYFNLGGEGSGNIYKEVMMINADYFTPIDSTLIPTGELRSVKGTPFDFTTPTPIGERIGADNLQIKYGKGYDHNFVLNPDTTKSLNLAARVYDPGTGIEMTVLTDQPGIQFYSGNFLAGNDKGKNGKPHEYRSAFCLETQHFPDSPNHANFPSTVLNPGDKYHSETIYKFSVLKNPGE